MPDPQEVRALAERVLADPDAFGEIYVRLLASYVLQLQDAAMAYLADLDGPEGVAYSTGLRALLPRHTQEGGNRG